MANDEVVRVIETALRALHPVLNERDRRLLAGTAALLLGRSGNTRVATITGVSKNTVTAGSKEILAGPTGNVIRQYAVASCPNYADIELVAEPLQNQADDTQAEAVPVSLPEEPTADSSAPPPEPRIRRPGAGRKSVQDKHPDLHARIEALILRSSGQDPSASDPLWYTVSSLRDLAADLAADPEHPITTSHKVIGNALTEMGYRNLNGRRQFPGKLSRPDRAAQFQRICHTAAQFLASGDPVLSLGVGMPPDLSGNSTAGFSYLPPAGHQDWSIPYVMYTFSNTVQRALIDAPVGREDLMAAALRIWLNHIGLPAFPNARRIYIVLENDVSALTTQELQTAALQDIAEESGWEIHVSHCPSGIYRWNDIAHQLYVLTTLEQTTLSLTLIGSGAAPVRRSFP